jgi:hypothetical protein
MTPTNLQGLNIVHPAQPHSSVSDSQDLLSVPPYPDLTAQLDLWTNLSFESDEPLIHNDDEKYLNRKKLPSRSDEDDDDDLNPREGTAPHDGHENVVTGTTIANNDSTTDVRQTSNFDLNQFLAGIGIDPFTVPNSQSPLPSGVPSIAQLLSLHSQQTGTGFYPPPPPPTLPPADIQQDVSTQPPVKRIRSRKVSVSTTESQETPYASSFPDHEPNTTTPVTPAEDKRRRNTAASARFRMKKKEREAALEKKAKELEVRVNELERECEGLRRENGWLKGLVVGVTGAQPASSGKKRSRDELEAGSLSVGVH